MLLNPKTKKYYNVSKIVSSLSFLSLYLQTIHALPTSQGRWRQPCQGSTQSQHHTLPSTGARRSIDDSLVAYSLWLKSHQVFESVQNLRDRYALERIQSSHLQDFLDANTTMPGFPDHRPLSSHTTLLERLVEDFRRTSIVAVFLEQLKADEMNSPLSPNFGLNYRDLESQIYPFLCHLQIAIQERTQTSLPSVSRNVMVASDRYAANNAERHRRDYRILKDVVLLFNSIATDYDFLRLEKIAVVTNAKKSILKGRR